MPVKKRKSKAKKVSSKKNVPKKKSVKRPVKKAVKKKAAPTKPKKSVKKVLNKAAPVTPDQKPKIESSVEDVLKQEMEKQGKDIFFPETKWTIKHWFRKYSPVIVTLLIGLVTYFYLVFYLFYPTTLLQGNYLQLLLLLVFIFLIAGLLVYLGLRAELLFVRILSFIFVFVIFTFLLLFILLAHTMKTGAL